MAQFKDIDALLREEQAKIDEVVKTHPHCSQSLPVRAGRPSGGICYGPPGPPGRRPAPPPWLPPVPPEECLVRPLKLSPEDYGLELCRGYLRASEGLHPAALRNFTWDAEADTWKPKFRLTLVFLAKEQFDPSEVVQYLCAYIQQKWKRFPLPHQVLSVRAMRKFLPMLRRVGLKVGVVDTIRYVASPERIAMYHAHRKKYYPGLY